MHQLVFQHHSEMAFFYFRDILLLKKAMLHVCLIYAFKDLITNDYMILYTVTGGSISISLGNMFLMFTAKYSLNNSTALF